jgi:hypothetical protein
MPPPADLTGANPVSAVGAPRPTASVADVRQESYERLSRLDIGKHYQAEILSRLTDGTFMARIADVAVRMNLPAGVEAGETLDLQLIAMQPRLTFLLGRPADAAAPATLSNAGKLIGTLLQAAQQEGAQAALVAKAPLMTLESDGTPQIASALKDTLSFSGLFYESHLSQWVQGDRPLSDLLREPQAALAKQPEQSAGAGPETDAHGLDAEAAKLIGLQLQTLEQQCVRWQGELWPGQPLEWEVQRDARGHEAGPERQAWQSVVRFELPNLGVVAAAIQLHGGQVRMQVRAADGSTAEALSSHRAALADALDAAGARLEFFTVKQDPSA